MHAFTMAALTPCSYEFLSQELLWHGFIEFLGFIVPFVDVQKLGSRVRTVFATTKRPLTDVEKKQMVWAVHRVSSLTPADGAVALRHVRVQACADGVPGVMRARVLLLLPCLVDHGARAVLAGAAHPPQEDESFCCRQCFQPLRLADAQRMPVVVAFLDDPYSN